MVNYRVGEQGATVLDEDGNPILSLPPGVVIVPGSAFEPGPELPERVHDGKRIRGYADKRLRGYANKRTAPHESTAD